MLLSFVVNSWVKEIFSQLKRQDMFSSGSNSYIKSHDV